jgi:hypothetical protein
LDDFLDEIRLLDLRSSRHVMARVVTLTRDLAQRKVDAIWWAGLGVRYRMRKDQKDHHWVWYKKVGKLRNDHFVRCVAVQTDDGEIQGTMIYHLNGQSLFEAEEGAVLIDYLATAPRNRPNLLYPQVSHYRDVGKGLVAVAMLHSYLLGFRGRANLQSLPTAEAFYEKNKFAWTGIEMDGMLFYEIPSSDATSSLEEWGLL